MRYHFTSIILMIAFITVFQSILANERRFTYIYETLTLGPGDREIEIWNTYRSNKNFFYRRLDQRVEFEFGISDKLMSSFYLNSSWLSQDSNGEKPGGEAVSSQEVSLSSEWKYKIFDRTADPVGLGFYSEATIGLNEFELEGKIILDKQFDNFLAAFNGTAEHEWDSELINGESLIERELQIEFNLGLAYFITSSFSFGIETKNLNLFNNGALQKSAFFGGPNISYTADKWWAALTILPQLTSFKGKTSGNLVLDEFEKIDARLLFSFNL